MVEAVRDAVAQEPETDWIEWKGHADLSTKAWQGELASHILGFSNRDPRLATRNAQGYAYLIVGVEPGALRGVDPIDTAKLDDGIARYVGGAEGPAWEPDYVCVDGVNVLVITVDPPRAGEPIWTLRKTFSDPAGNSHHDGRIFIRRMAKTSAQPTSAELDMLQRRAQGARTGLDLDVVVRGEGQISAIDISSLARDRWLRRRRSRFLSQLPQEERSELTSMFTVAKGPLDEARSPKTFTKQVDDYLGQLAPLFPPIAHAEAVEAGVGRVQLEVQNKSSDNFHKLLIELYVEGEVRAYFDSRDAEEGLEWPKRPRDYGTSVLTSIGAGLTVPEITPFRQGSIDNSASARVRFPVFDLRPGYSSELDEIFLIVDQTQAGGELRASWVATSTSVSGSAKGALTIPIAAEPLFVDEF
ncbi:MAG: hypothetical protein QOF13_374 [Solirubrobacterales bacterium]|jgi:hypothetical protein|nr:hypothetical protein [Solirubrobacterales bacterium]